MMHAIAELLVVASALTAFSQPSAPPPFKVGERAEYDLVYSFGLSKTVGSASMEVKPVVSVRGREAYQFVFALNGSAAMFNYSIRDTIRSWLDTTTFHTLRSTQDQVEKGKVRKKRYEIFPERAVYVDSGKPEQASVINPLDEISFLYFVRTQGLDQKTPYHFERYFQPEKNPVQLRVLRRETIEVPWGKIKTVVVRPIFKTRGGMFSESAKAEVWFSDDSARVIVRMKVGAPIGSLTMKLKSYRASTTAVTLGRK